MIVIRNETKGKIAAQLHLGYANPKLYKRQRHMIYV